MDPFQTQFHDFPQKCPKPSPGLGPGFCLGLGPGPRPGFGLRPGPGPGFGFGPGPVFFIGSLGYWKITPGTEKSGRIRF